MSKYKLVTVLWEDATHATSQELPEILEDLIIPSLTTGILYKQNKRYVIIASHIERYVNRAEADYMIILKGSIISIKEHDIIEIDL